MESYPFTPAEAAFFAPRLAEARAQQNVLAHAITLICAQQKLAGTWRIADDGSGLIQIQEPQIEAPPVSAS